MLPRSALSSRDGDCTIDSKAAVPSCFGQSSNRFREKTKITITNAAAKSLLRLNQHHTAVEKTARPMADLGERQERH